jgi:hypothetical protein
MSLSLFVLKSKKVIITLLFSMMSSAHGYGLAGVPLKKILMEGPPVCALALGASRDAA